jgi:NAD(P)-dependent dehydrogenase (short-subunit alcohol dehydrogenase family)
VTVCVPVLEGRAAIVTGAGKGLGRAVALALAAAGADVALAARSRPDLERVAEEVSVLGRRVLAVPTDVTERDQVEALVERTVDELGGLDVLVNNAGVVREGPLLETSDEDWDTVIETNVRGTFLCTRAAGRVLTENRSGKIINVASNLGLIAVSRLAAYCASKGAIVQFTKVMALEWASFGIQVNAIAPGYFETDMNTAIRARPEVLGRVLSRIPSGRMGRPEELGALAVFLASSASDFMTGETIVMDGGQVAW